MSAMYTDKLKKKIKEMSSTDLFCIAIDAISALYERASLNNELSIFTTSRNNELNIDIICEKNDDNSN